MIVAESLELLHHSLGVEDDTLEVYNSDPISKAGERGFGAAGMQGEINQSEHRQHKQKEGSAPNQHP
jgi:hypothetical protein